MLCTIPQSIILIFGFPISLAPIPVSLLMVVPRPFLEPVATRISLCMPGQAALCRAVVRL